VNNVGRTGLRCAIDPTTSFENNLLNCSASDKQKGRDDHVREAPRPNQLLHLILPFVLSNMKVYQLIETTEL